MARIPTPDCPGSRIINLGRIAGAQGLKGWVRVISYTEPREAILDYRPWLVGDGHRPVKVLEGARRGKSVVARLEGVSNRDDAENLNGLEIGIERSQLPGIGDEHFYWADLIGLEVILQEGESLGRIEQMMATGANDVMVVEGDRQRLIPFLINQTVTEVDLKSGRIIVDWDAEF